MTGGVRARRAVTAVLSTLLSLLVLTLLGTPASAHTELDNAVPADGARLVKTPGSIQLNFTEPIDAELGSVVVRGPDGRNLAAGPARQSGPGLIQPVTASREAGTVQVSYRVVSLDGHPVTGTYSFEVLRGDPNADRVEPGSAAAGGSGEDGSGASLTIPLLLGTAMVVVLVAAGALLARRRGAGDSRTQAQTTTPPVR